MEEFIPGQVYENLIKMCGYRGIKLTGEPLDSGTVVQKINHYEFVTISGSRPANDIRGPATTIIILIAPKSKYSTKSVEFKKLLKGLPKVKEGENLEVMFVSDVPLTVHIEKHLRQFKDENPKIILEDHNYSIFLIETPKHSSVPLHKIAPIAEVEWFCRRYYKNKDNFPRILQSDPQAVWLGLRPGMVVKIYRISETAGIAIAYRICVR